MSLWYQTFLVICLLFKECHFFKKIRFNKHIDFICYSPAEFQKIKNTFSIVIDALEYGESIIP